MFCRAEDKSLNSEHKNLSQNETEFKNKNDNGTKNNPKLSDSSFKENSCISMGIEGDNKVDNCNGNYNNNNFSFQDLLCDYEDNNFCVNANVLRSKEDKLFFEKHGALQNSISSTSGISNSYFVEEEKQLLNHEKTHENRINFESICGLHEIKERLLNIIVYPTIYPHFFPASIHWNRILLYGPPGSGKTMLAKAIANEIGASLQRISSSDLLSHWQGESEKQIRNLFESARSNARSEPTILFFDEIDGLCRKRCDTEDDSVRRIKTELLVQFEDSNPECKNHQTYIIGATNCPWEIDSAFIRRFHNKIFIPLPEKETRLDILKKGFENIKTDLSAKEWNEIGEKTKGYSGSDLVNVVMSSCCERLLQMKKCKYWEAKADVWVPVNSHSLFLTRMNFEDIPQDKVGSRDIIFSDLEAGIANTAPSLRPEEVIKYLEFSENFK